MISKIICTLLVGFIGLSVQAKENNSKKASQFYVLFDDGCEHPVETCEGKAKLPNNLKKKKEFVGNSGYRGTVQTEFADKNEAGIDAYEHYFADQKSCDNALKKKNCAATGEGP